LGALAVIGFGSFVVVSAIVGLRLLRIAIRTGEVPELAIGTALFAGGGVGHGLIVASFALHAFPAAMTPIAVLIGNAAASAGAIALAFGVWRMFRPFDRWPRIVIGVIVALLAISLLERLRNIGIVPAPPQVFWTITIGGAVSFAWSAIESLRFHAMMRRRMRIGLADAATTRRFLLWGIAASAAVAIHVCAAVNRFLDPGTIALPLLLVQDALGLTAAIGIWFAFFPPRRRVQGEHVPG
jgi:hypothetical protein